VTAPPALPAAGRGQVVARITALSAASAAAMPTEAVVSALGTSADDGLGTAEAARRRAAVGANALRDHSARPLAVLIRQFRSPLLGSRRLARCKVLVKRLVSIEDLGDMNLLVTDKTGTLTEGRITLSASVKPAGGDDGKVRDLGREPTCRSRRPAGESAGESHPPPHCAAWAVPSQVGRSDCDGRT
jgi:hypothetical protein